MSCEIIHSAPHALWTLRYPPAHIILFPGSAIKGQDNSNNDPRLAFPPAPPLSSRPFVGRASRDKIEILQPTNKLTNKIGDEDLFRRPPLSLRFDDLFSIFFVTGDFSPETTPPQKLLIPNTHTKGIQKRQQNHCVFPSCTTKNKYKIKRSAHITSKIADFNRFLLSKKIPDPFFLRFKSSTIFYFVRIPSMYVKLPSHSCNPALVLMLFYPATMLAVAYLSLVARRAQKIRGNLYIHRQYIHIHSIFYTRDTRAAYRYHHPAGSPSHFDYLEAWFGIVYRI